MSHYPTHTKKEEEDRIYSMGKWRTEQSLNQEHTLARTEFSNWQGNRKNKMRKKPSNVHYQITRYLESIIIVQWNNLQLNSWNSSTMYRYILLQCYVTVPMSSSVITYCRPITLYKKIQQITPRIYIHYLFPMQLLQLTVECMWEIFACLNRI